MLRNQKKPFSIPNRTHYFDPTTTRTTITVSSPFSYNSRRQKIEGYETRLYYQFLWCRDIGGQTFFYTLTYNDKAVPHLHGMNVFDYNDLRDLLTGGFRKMLLRKYGTVFKYFIGAELGDGKGSRGFHNNPHYHILFFLEDAKNKKYPYKKITPVEFRHLVRVYWQGFDEFYDGWKSYNQAKYGIAREGDNCGLVSDFRACMYVAKYVCKDAKFKQQETRLRSLLWNALDEKFKKLDSFWKEFFEKKIVPIFSSDSHPYTKPELFIQEHFPSCNPRPDMLSFKPYCMMFLERFHLWDILLSFKCEYFEPHINESILEFRNRYSNKARISQGCGLYALEFIRDKFNPSIPIPTKNGFKYRPLCLYYYRKLFCDVIKDPNTGNNMYLLNENGQKYKLSKLQSSLDRIANEAKSNLDILKECPTLLDIMVLSNVNTSGLKFNSGLFFRHLKELDIDVSELCKRYAEFKFIYSGRYFNRYTMPAISPISDYGKFLVPSFYTTTFDEEGISAFKDDTNYIGYEKHEYFAPYRRLFAVFDLCSDYFFVQKDDRNQAKAEEIEKTRRFHVVSELSVKYGDNIASVSVSMDSNKKQFYI